MLSFFWLLILWYFIKCTFSCMVQYYLYHNMDIVTVLHCTLVSSTPSQSIGPVFGCRLFQCWVSLGAPVTISLIWFYFIMIFIMIAVTIIGIVLNTQHHTHTCTNRYPYSVDLAVHHTFSISLSIPPPPPPPRFRHGSPHACVIITTGSTQKYMIRYKMTGLTHNCSTQHVSVAITTIKHPLLWEIIFSYSIQTFFKNP